MKTEKRKEYEKQWRLDHPDKCKSYTQKYQDKNRDKIRNSSKKWKVNNPEDAKESRRQTYAKYRDERRADNRERYMRCRIEWIKWLTEHNLTTCSVCGYDKCFDAIDYHHTNPLEKEKGVAYILCHRISPKGIAEIEKTIPLCRNCHAELHSQKRAEKCLNN